MRINLFCILHSVNFDTKQEVSANSFPFFINIPDPMKHTLQFLFLSACLFLSSLAMGQATVCPISAGPDQTICVPNCATLTGTFVPTHQTTNYVASTIPYAPDPFNVGTSIVVGDDQYSGVIPLPFTFCYYGTAYNSCIIGSNGVISFAIANANAYCQWPISAAVPSASDPVNCIMGPWQDLYPPGGGTIRYTTYGAAPCRRFVVSWNQMAMYSCTTTLCTQQIVLYETTNVIDNFIQSKGTCAWNGGYAIQAVHNATGSAAVSIPGRNYPTVWTTSNDAKRWTPSGANNYQVGWYQGATLISNTTSTVVCPTATTAYTFQATYTNCNNTTVTVNDQMIVTVNTLPTTAGPDQTICQGSCTNLTGNATGATGYSWAIIPGNINVGSTQTINVCPTVTTTYVVTATSPVCTGTDTVVVHIFAMNTANAGPDDSICSGNCTTLNGSGGVTYSWTPTASITGPANIANPQVCPTVTTQYTVAVTDANGCTGHDSVIVYVAPTPLSVTITGVNNTCFNSCNGQATANPVGGYPPYTYSWSNAATGQTASSLCAGSYTVTVTDHIGCTATASVTITEPTAVQITATSIVTANCGQNDGAVTISITGGTPGPGYTILWPATGNNGLTEQNLPPGQVCVYVYDANGCGDTLCVTVPNTPGANVTVTSFTNVTCNGACDGTAIALGSGGTQPYNYSWNSTPQAQLNDTANNLCPGVYTVTMSDANGCTNTATVLITEPTLLTNTPSGANTLCIGQSANLTDVANGGTPGYSYNWTDGITTWNTQNILVSPTVTTTYTVYVTDANNCISANQTIVVNVNPPLQVQPMAGITVCANTVVNLTATGSGGNGNLSYLWTPINLPGSSVSTTVTSTTTYTVTVVDNCGTPSASGTVTVTVNPAPVVNFTATSATSGCQVLCVDFQNNTPNTATIAWEFGNNLGTSTQANPTFCFANPGVYDVTATVTDVIGCVGTTTLTNIVTVWPLPVANFSASPQPATILNNQVQFTDLSLGANAWIWSFGMDDSASVLQNPMYPFQDTGTFNVQLIVTNQYGCQDDITLPIYVHEDYALYIPNAFTPNGDGLNDMFIPMGMGADPDHFSMYIFDRWGNTIYQTSTWPGGWDGTVQGTSRRCPVDTYVYKITTMDPEGTRKVYIGKISIVN